MSLAAEIRRFHVERCSVAEIADYLHVSRRYVRFVLRQWGLLPPTQAAYPDTARKLRYAAEHRA